MIISNVRVFLSIVVVTVVYRVANIFDNVALFFGYGIIEKDTFSFEKQYDFIVIGSGSAGSVVASRLSENATVSVLLLEAGTLENYFTNIPVAAPLQSSTYYSWGYKTETTNTACLGFQKQKCVCPSGKALGGSTVINYLVYSRGSKLDYDEWRDLGNPDWGYSDVLPYFKKFENCSQCTDINAEFHGFEGPMNIETPLFKSPIVDAFLRAGETMDYQIVDPNGPSVLGFSKILSFTRNGRRCTSAKAFLQPVKKRNNLHISLNSYVQKIIINSQTKKATGVEFVKHNIKHVINARKEIILSAGALDSPKLLMLSGIGPKKELNRFKIPVIQDLSVGYNLKNHMSALVLAFLVNDSSTTFSLAQAANIKNVYNYAIKHRGPFTLPGGAQAIAFVQTKFATNSSNFSDVQLVLGVSGLNNIPSESLQLGMGLPIKTYDAVYGPHVGKPSFSISIFTLKPKSTGRILLNSKNAHDPPRIEANYFSNLEDVATMVEAFKLAVKVGLSEPFKKYNVQLIKNKFPMCEDFEFGSDLYWECVARHYATGGPHYAGTCKMGPKNDSSAVVDSGLKVYGIDNLRVVDGSIMPTIVGSETSAAIMMIAEKASDKIKADNKL